MTLGAPDAGRSRSVMSGTTSAGGRGALAVGIHQANCIGKVSMSWTHSYTADETPQPALDDDLVRARETFTNAKRNLEEAHRELLRIHGRVARRARKNR